MNNEYGNKIEEALSLYESGMPPGEILPRFPENQEELKDIFSLLSTLSKEKEKMTPRRELLSRILGEMHSPSQASHSETREVRSGFLSNWFMYAAPVSVALLIVVIIGLQKEEESPTILTLSEDRGAAESTFKAADTMLLTVDTESGETDASSEPGLESSALRTGSSDSEYYRPEEMVSISSEDASATQMAESVAPLEEGGGVSTGTEEASFGEKIKSAFIKIITLVRSAIGI